MPIGTPYIPETITVHLGPPDSYAQNVTLSFVDYIKNVASSEVYPSWQEAALRANIFAQISYALNRYYLEFYRSGGYNFDITNSNAIDQKFINGRNIFSNIDALVDEIFNTYIRRIGFIEPLAAKYCNGTTVTCEGLSQWGSEGLAQSGYDSVEILTYYYGDDVELVVDAPVQGARESYPGYPLRQSSVGPYVRLIQNQLNRVSQNYPMIPKISSVDGVFDQETEDAVRLFQQIFNLTPDGIVGRATWYKLNALFIGIANLSELNSEGYRLFDVSLEYPDAIEEGDTGEKVEILQYFLRLIAEFYLTIPSVPFTGRFGSETKDSVLAFQQQFKLPQTGIANAATWDAIYNTFRSIVSTVFTNREIFAVKTLPYGGEVLRYGSQGELVRALQQYLNAISLTYPSIQPIAVTGAFDRETRTAVMQYQMTFGLPQTGTVDRTDWNSITDTYKNAVSALTSRPMQYPGKVLREGDQDADRIMQTSMAIDIQEGRL